MMSHKINPQHLQRLAGVYIRQSSLGQVKNNRESYRVQKGLTARAEELGWAANQIKCFEADQGQSASTPMTRGDFDSLLQMIQEQQMGIVFSVDVTRLARNSIDLSMLIHWSAVHGTLIADQYQVYDPTTEDSVVLGIQGVLAVNEVRAIRKRLQACLDEKASRGQLHQGVPRGYVVVEGMHLRKHPNRRVQQVIQKVLDQFPTCSSVSALLRWTWEQKIKLPRPAASGDGSRIEWVEPNYRGLIDMLRNPKYAGVYVYPRYQQEAQVLACGKVPTRRRLSRPDEWTTVIKDHHPAYITLSQHEANQRKIAMNAQRYTSSRGAVNRGASLLAGLVECRRCGHKMQVSYSKRGRVSYDCRNGRRQRDTDLSRCFRFSADALERQLSEQVLYAVSPAGVAAAEVAAERLAGERADRRATLSDHLEQLRYEADLTRRRLDAVDPANRLVYATLCEEWEVNLRAVSEHESLLSQFDTDDPPRPTSEERALLDRLGERLADVWHDASTDGGLKQQVVRLLIDHVYADVDESQDEVVLWLKWTSGHHTELRGPRRGSRRNGKRHEIASLLDTLRKIDDDESISRVFNRSGLKTESGETWTKQRVSACRRAAGIRAFSEKLKASEGWLTQQEAATNLGISPMSLNRLIQAGIIASEGAAGFPQVILASDLTSKAIQAAAKQIRNHPNAPLPTNPNQKTLSF
jgi:DNA invertase Pin-like site-specific DNA recombinase